MNVHLSLALGATLLLPLVPSAQTVELRGKVEDGEGACYYCPGFDHVLDGVNFPITSSVVDLDTLIAQQIHAFGTWNGSTTAPVVDLTSVTVVTETFSFGGGGGVGDELDFTVHANPGDLATIAGSLATGFQPFGANATLLFLDPATLVILGNQVVGFSGEATIELGPLPPAAVGLNVVGQALLFPNDGSLPYFTNPDFETIRP